MTSLDDDATAIESYLDAHVNVEIRDVNSPGDRLIVNETGTFDVLITNHGPLRMKDVQIRIRGLNGVLVEHQGALNQLSDEMTVAPPGEGAVIAAKGGTYLIADRGDWDQTLSYAAPDTPMSQRSLIDASIADWTADITPIPRRSSGSGASTTYIGRVVAA